MKNKKISVKTIIIILLVGINIALIIMNLNNKNNSIEQQLMQKEQLGETTEDNSYVKVETHLSEVKEKEQKLLSFKSTIANTLTEMGVETSTNADATTMASNIRSLSENDSDLGDIVQILVPNASGESTYYIIAPSATVSYYLSASTGGGFISLDGTTIKSVSAGYNETNSVSGSFECTQGQKLTFRSQYGGSVTITEHF